MSLVDAPLKAPEVQSLPIMQKSCFYGNSEKK